ncbi:hypothetical protein [Aurantibacillus circumpalustris]|uniref:hypothetical protein n=1 Tax=Aurantibacillus circumpalustris TaxID=3036359 RepID=UPI00295A655B|nr:hypothetical protein [Aurantibacillus circumpalustris]
MTKSKAYLEITLNVAAENRSSAGLVYTKYKQPFLDKAKGALSKELLIRDQDVQVLHGFDTEQNASDYLKSELFSADIVKDLSPLLKSDPEMRIYSVA